MVLHGSRSYSHEHVSRSIFWKEEQSTETIALSTNTHRVCSGESIASVSAPPLHRRPNIYMFATSFGRRVTTSTLCCSCPYSHPKTNRFSRLQATWTTLLGDARQGLVNADPLLTPPEEGNLPPPPNASTSIGLLAGNTTPTTAPGGNNNNRHSQPNSSSSSSSHGLLAPPTLQSEATGGEGYNRSATASTAAPGTAASSRGGGKISTIGGTAVSAHGATPLAERENAEGHSAVPSPEAGSRRAGRGAAGGKTGSAGASAGGGSGGPSHFDTEMEANRLAYVLHLQVCALLCLTPFYVFWNALRGTEIFFKRGFVPNRGTMWMYGVGKSGHFRHGIGQIDVVLGTRRWKARKAHGVSAHAILPSSRRARVACQKNARLPSLATGRCRNSSIYPLKLAHALSAQNERE